MSTYSRSRSSSNLGSPILSVHSWGDNDCSQGTIVDAAVAVGRNGYTKTMDDVVWSDFAVRSARGELIINPMKMTRTDYTSSGNGPRIQSLTQSCSSPIKYPFHDWTGPLTFPSMGLTGFVKAYPAIPEEDISSVNSLAATSCWSNSAQHSASLLQDLAELRQLLMMLRDPLQKGHKLFDKIKSASNRGFGRKSAVRGLADGVDYASSMWLQWRFGVRPLISSVNGVLKALSEFKSRTARQTSRGQASTSAESSSTVNNVFVGSSYYVDYTMQTSDTYRCECGVNIDEVITLSQHLGFDTSSLLALPWELVPYSFVADWFANVGNFLYAVYPSVTSKPAASWTKKVRRYTTVYNIVGSRPQSGWSLTRAPYETRSTTVEITERIPGIIGPSIAFKPHAYKDVLNDARLLDSFALLAVRFGSIFGR